MNYEDFPVQVNAEIQRLERQRSENEVRRVNAELEKRVAQRTAELAAAKHELEAFTHSVSHELRAPLRRIASLAKILTEDHSGKFPKEARRFLDHIEAEALRGHQLADDLLNLAGVDRRELPFDPVDLHEIVRDVIEGLKLDTKSRTIEWKVGTLPTVQGDSVLLRQVFENLISNALKFTRTRSTTRIELGTTMCNGVQTIFVRDNGVGFQMRYIEKLFTPFERLHRAVDYEGTGIGLATVKRIVQRHGWTIWAESQVDEGATFYLGYRATDDDRLRLDRSRGEFQNDRWHRRRKVTRAGKDHLAPVTAAWPHRDVELSPIERTS